MQIGLNDKKEKKNKNLAERNEEIKNLASEARLLVFTV